MSPDPAAVRPAVDGDLDAIEDLYSHYIRTTHITFDVEPMGAAARLDWFGHYGLKGRHRLLVAVDAGRVLGYASSSPFRPKAAYATSVETSVYLAADATGRGLGTRLYRALFAALEDEDVHRAYAGISLPNPASIRLHESLGYTQVGHFHEQGRKFGRYWDVVWYERDMG